MSKITEGLKKLRELDAANASDLYDSWIELGSKNTAFAHTIMMDFAKEPTKSKAMEVQFLIAFATANPGKGNELLDPLKKLWISNPEEAWKAIGIFAEKVKNGVEEAEAANAAKQYILDVNRQIRTGTYGHREPTMAAPPSEDVASVESPAMPIVVATPIPAMPIVVATPIAEPPPEEPSQASAPVVTTPPTSVTPPHPSVGQET